MTAAHNEPIAPIDDSADINAADVEDALRAIAVVPQLKLNSFGLPAPFQPGTTVRIIQVPWQGMGQIVKQHLHYDCGSTFWGNIDVLTVGGVIWYLHSWQVERVSP